ncbi:MAG: DUF5647 family protein [Candidatus Binatia bacterium]
MDIVERKNALLLTEFDRYVMEHPKFAAKIPRNAQVVLQLEGDEEYNTWSRRLAERQRESGQAVIYVSIQGLKPARSRLVRPTLGENLRS